MQFIFHLPFENPEQGQVRSNLLQTFSKHTLGKCELQFTSLFKITNYGCLNQLFVEKVLTDKLHSGELRKLVYVKVT